MKRERELMRHSQTHEVSVSPERREREGITRLCADWSDLWSPCVCVVRRGRRLASGFNVHCARASFQSRAFFLLSFARLYWIFRSESPLIRSFVRVGRKNIMMQVIDASTAPLRIMRLGKLLRVRVMVSVLPVSSLRPQLKGLDDPPHIRFVIQVCLLVFLAALTLLKIDQRLVPERVLRTWATIGRSILVPKSSENFGRVPSPWLTTSAARSTLEFAKHVSRVRFDIVIQGLRVFELGIIDNFAIPHRSCFLCRRLHNFIIQESTISGLRLEGRGFRLEGRSSRRSRSSCRSQGLSL